MAGSLNMAYLCIALTILLTVYGQFILKWQASLLMGQQQGAGYLAYIVKMLLNPWVMSGLAAAFGASICWMLAVSRLELGRAYPFMALNFVLVGLIAAPLLGEAYSVHKCLGLAFIVLGLIISSQG